MILKSHPCILEFTHNPLELQVAFDDYLGSMRGNAEMRASRASSHASSSGSDASHRHFRPCGTRRCEMGRRWLACNNRA